MSSTTQQTPPAYIIANYRQCGFDFYQLPHYPIIRQIGCKPIGAALIFHLDNLIVVYFRTRHVTMLPIRYSAYPGIDLLLSFVRYEYFLAIS